MTSMSNERSRLLEHLRIAPEKVTLEADHHEAAEDLLLELLNDQEITEAWKKRSVFWYYA